MSYGLGIDLGATFSSAAISRDGTVEVVTLGQRAASVPSVLHLGQDGTVAAGEAAERRGQDDHWRTTREFKRRLGDDIPILVAGTSFSVQLLMAHQLRSVYDHVVERQGSVPSALTVSHPAGWGPFKVDLMNEAFEQAGLKGAELVTDPEAAGFELNAGRDLEYGSIVAVYDLGGTTFGTALLRKGAGGEMVAIGSPNSIDRTGGVSFDQAIFEHVRSAVDGGLEDVDRDDPLITNALIRLRQECTQAKEALSTDTEVTIPVGVGSISTTVRLTRVEFEDMIRPTIEDTLSILRQTIVDGGRQPDDISTIQLVGGSAAVPLVGEMVTAEFGTPVALDRNPAFSVVRGAAGVAEAALTKASAAVLHGTPLEFAAGGEAVDQSSVLGNDEAGRGGEEQPIPVSLREPAAPRPATPSSRVPRSVSALVVAAALLLFGGGAAAAFGAGPFGGGLVGGTAGSKTVVTSTVSDVADPQLARTDLVTTTTIPSTTVPETTVVSTTVSSTVAEDHHTTPPHHTTTTVAHHTTTAPPHHTTSTEDHHTTTTTTDPHHTTTSTTEETTTTGGPHPTTKEIPIPPLPPMPTVTIGIPTSSTTSDFFTP